MSDQGPLIVPMPVEAWVVNDHVRLGPTTFFRAQMPYNAIQTCANGQANLSDNDPGFISSSPVHGVSPAEFYNGVYLKWRLPKALTHGTHDGAAGKTTHPPVPNRWLIVRMGGALANRQPAAWIVESDYVWTGAPPMANASQVPSNYVGSSGSGKPVGIRIGRNVPLGSWREPGTTLQLTAMAPGNPAFAFYQPQNNNVFSFIDVLGNAADQTSSYQVFGWFSDPKDDPLYGVPASGFAAKLTSLGWTLPPRTDSAATASWSIFAGMCCGVQWQTETVPPGGAPRVASPVPIAVGNSSIEALTAMVTAQAVMLGKSVEPELLEALQLDLLDVLDEPDGAAILADKLLASFFQRYSGGYTWTIVDAPGATGATGATSRTERRLLGDWLATLNQDQAALDADLRALAALQAQLYAMWWKYESWPFRWEGTTSIPHLDDQHNLRQQLDPAVSGSLGQMTATLLAAVEARAARIPHGNTPEALQTAIDDYATRHGLPATRQLKRSAAPSFYLPNNPVVLIAGAGASGIVDDVAETLCRFPAQLVAGFTYDKKTTVDASTPGLKIPRADLSGVTGVPWSVDLAKALAGEFFFVDPANATMVSAAIPGSTAASVAAAMADPANALLVWPKGAAQVWDPKLNPFRNPWHPLLLLWQATYYPIGYGTTAAPNWSFHDERYVWNGSPASVDTTYPLSLSGLIQLSPTASFNMEARIKAFLRNNSNLDPKEAAAFNDLLNLVQTSDDWDLLSQSLNGFNEQLRGAIPGVFLSPRGASASLISSPSIADLIGDVHGYPPGLPPIPTQRPPPSQFQPWRSGQFVFSNLLVVDEWGQALWSIDQYTKATETVYLPPDLAAVVSSDPVSFEIRATALRSADGGVGTDGPAIATLTPNLMQAGMAPSATFPLTIAGSGFGPDSVAKWNGIPLSTTVVSGTGVTVQVPASFVMMPGINQVTVTAHSVTSTPATFTVSAGAAIGALSPSSAVAGGPALTLTVMGVGFQPQSEVAWNGQRQSTTFVNDTVLTAQVPASALAAAGTAAVTVLLGHQAIPDAPDSFIQIPPSLLQPARLSFDLVSAVDDAVKFGPAAPTADPICGWVMPNHLDASLLAYDARGVA